MSFWQTRTLSPGRPFGFAFGRGDGLADVLVHDFIERLLHDRDGRLVGDAQAVDEIGLQAGRLHRPGDGFAAAVDHDDVDADRGEKGDVVGDPRAQRRDRDRP